MTKKRIKKNEVGALLRKWRVTAGLNQMQAGINIDVSMTSITSWEVGRTLPSTLNLPALRNAYKLSAKQLEQLVDAIEADRYVDAAL